MIFRALLIKKEDKKIDINIIEIVLGILTVLVWIIFTLSSLWILTSLIWVLLSQVWFKSLYLPYSIQFTLTIFLLLIVWGILVSIACFLFHRRRQPMDKHLQDINPEIFNCHAQSHPWTEIVYFDSKYQNAYVLKKNTILTEELERLSPSKMLSHAINLYNQGMIKEAIGILRLIIDNPNSNSLLVQVAQYRLIQLLPYSGEIGVKITKKMEEDR
jgi:hypothetical protein